MTGVDDLVRWLGEQLDADERIAREATPGPWQNAPTARHHATASGRSEEAVFASPPDVGAMVVAITGEASERRNLINAEFMARHDPARVLREVDAKWQMLGFLVAELERTDSPWWYDGKLEKLLKLLALPYADRPNYREEWRP